MKVSLLLFAGLRDAVGDRNLCFDVAEGSTVADLKRQLGAAYPNIEPMLETVVCAIDDDYVGFETVIREGAEVALIPPVSGGAVDTTPELYRLTREVMDAQALADLVQRDEAGALALFYGNVRNHSEGKQVERLEYESHDSMAVAKMRQAAQETRERFPEISEVGVWHRVGMLEIGETSLLVAVSSAHRKEAFEACHWCVDRVKEIVPVWKKEHWVGGGAEWVPGHTVEVD
jgi:molybdopterin converting factor subunit 1